MEAFGRAGLRNKAVCDAAQAARCLGHASGMVTVREFSGRDSQAWQAEAAAWDSRLQQIIGSCVFSDLRDTVETTARGIHNVTYRDTTACILEVAKH